MNTTWPRHKSCKHVWCHAHLFITQFQLQSNWLLGGIFWTELFLCSSTSQFTEFTIIITTALGTPLKEMYLNRSITKMYFNFVKFQILVIWGFKVSAVKITSQIHSTFLVDSVLSVITYKQIARRSGHNSVSMSTSAHGAGRAESNASAWLTASEISALRCTAPQIFETVVNHTKCSQPSSDATLKLKNKNANRYKYLWKKSQFCQKGGDIDGDTIAKIQLLKGS